VADEWITTQEAAEIIGVTRNHVRHLIRHGELQAKRFGRAWMVSRKSAEAYAAIDRRPGPKSQSNT
jgi:excisionase family DNA binding protein